MTIKSFLYFSFQIFSQILSENPLAAFEELTNSPTHGLSACTHESNFRSDVFQRSILADRIIGGVLAAENEWPYIARLTVTQGSNNYLCSGTVIDNHWVLTAAHCCQNSDSIKATFSDLNKKLTESNEYELTAKKFEIQPQFGSGYDLCLLNFEEDIIETDPDRDVQIACLPDVATFHGKACWVAGWGSKKLGGKLSNKLRQAGVNVMSQEYCREFSDIPWEHFYEDDICAGLPDTDGDGRTEGGVDACQGDSGGPLLCEFNGKATLVGVVSRGYGCAHEGYPGLYSSVYHSQDWIRETVLGNEEQQAQPPTTSTSTTELNQPEFADITNIPLPALHTCYSDTNFPAERIFGGKFANKNHWSFMARVKATESSRTRTCGGTIIDNHWLLTSASCCEDVDSIQATFNDVHRSKNEAGEFTMNADQFEIHPSYGQGFDLCLIHFEEDIIGNVQNSGAEVVCLSDTLPVHGSACWIAGWGRKDNGYFSWKLREATVNIFDRNYCKEFSNYIDFYEDDICAGVPDRDENGLIDGGIDACDGDSGGPLICDFDGRATLVGVISRGNGCALEGYPGIYSSIAHSYNWIQEIVGAEKIEDSEDDEPKPEFQSLSNIILPNLQTCSHGQNFPEERFFWTNRIVGGSLAEENQWPYIVRLDVRWGSWASYTCGGTIVDNHWVVSAAHCCVGMRTIYGTFSDLRTNRNEENEYTLKADQLVVQPNYGNGNNGYDICMIHFSEDIIAIDPDQDVNMACINDALPAHGSSCWVAGWGTTQFYGQLSDKLLQAGVNIMNMEYCIRNSHEMILFEDDICAGVPDKDLNGLIDGGIDACQGDSGGPLICAMDGKATLVGVVSRGYGCAGEGYPGLYSSIAHSYDWIQELVRSGPPSSSAPSPPSTENNDGRSQRSGPVTECDSTTIIISAHINDLYGNLPEDLWDEVRLIVGTCNGTKQHESGWIVETFELGTCGGEISQNDDITFEWRVCGSRSLISRDGVYVTSKLGFDAKCVYPSTTTVGTHVDVQQIKNCHDDFLIENECAIPGNGSFSDLVQLDFYKDEAYQSEAVDLNIGEIIYGLISENKTSSFNFTYQITKCTTYQNSNKTGTSYDLISSPCQETDSSHFLELDITDLTGKNSNSEDNASFHFNTFTFNENDDELHFECELKICIEDFETGDLIDQNCIETCS